MLILLLSIFSFVKGISAIKPSKEKSVSFFKAFRSLFNSFGSLLFGSKPTLASLLITASAAVFLRQLSTFVLLPHLLLNSLNPFDFKLAL